MLVGAMLLNVAAGCDRGVCVAVRRFHTNRQRTSKSPLASVD
jgi:hypothetical protein